MIIFALAFLCVLLFSPVSDAISISPGEKAPDFNLSTINGNVISLSEQKDNIVMLIYLRAGQERSVLAIRDALNVAGKYKGEDVKIFGVVADDVDEARKTLEEGGADFPVIVDSERKIYSSYGIRVYPTTVIIGRDGSVVYGIPSHPLTYRKILDGYVRKALGVIDEEQLDEAISPQKEKKDEEALEAMRLYNLALKFTESGLIDMAIDTAHKAVDADPRLPKPMMLLGFLYLEVKEADKALEIFDKLKEMDAHSNDVKTGIGGALVLKGEIDKAIEVLTSATVANPYPQMTYYELGKAYELAGKKDKSIEMYKKAIEKIIEKNILPSSVSQCD